MHKTIIISAAAVICVGLITWLLLKVFREPDETETMYCGPDKTMPVKVFVNPSEAYPVFAKDYAARVQGSLSVMDSVSKAISPSGTGAIEMQNKVIQLRDNLSQESIRMEILMKSNFYAYNARPCDNEVSKNYFEVIKLMAEKTSELDKLTADLTTTVPVKSNEDSGTTSSGVTTTVVKDTEVIKQSLKRFETDYFFVSDTSKRLSPALRNILSTGKVQEKRG